MLQDDSRVMSEGLSCKEPRFNIRGLHVVISLIGDECLCTEFGGPHHGQQLMLIECSENEKCKPD
jgi:hypothetical protein